MPEDPVWRIIDFDDDEGDPIDFKTVFRGMRALNKRLTSIAQVQNEMRSKIRRVEGSVVNNFTMPVKMVEEYRKVIGRFGFVSFSQSTKTEIIETSLSSLPVLLHHLNWHS